MKGAIIGDIVGSVYEHYNIKTKEFPLFCNRSRYTDDSLLTVAVADALLISANDKFSVIENVKEKLIEYGLNDINNGFGRGFRNWLLSDNHEPYNSFGNGAVMRCSPVAMIAKNADEAEQIGGFTALPTHNHPQAIKAASLLCRWIFELKAGMQKDEFLNIVKEYYEIPVLDEIRPIYEFDITCDGTLPVAVAAFLESTDFEDAIRNAISIGGDSDTIAAVTGALAEAYYGVPENIWEQAKKRLPHNMLEVIQQMYDLQ